MPDNTQELDEIKRLYSCIMHDFHDGKDREDMWVREVGLVVNKRIEAVLNQNISPDTLLLEQNKRLIEAGDALYERASYTGRHFDGTHRLLSAAAHWLDVRGKSSGKYQAERNKLKESK